MTSRVSLGHIDLTRYLADLDLPTETVNLESFAAPPSPAAWHAWARRHDQAITIEFTDGLALRIPAAALRLQDDGTFTLPDDVLTNPAYRVNAGPPEGDPAP